MSLQTSDTSKVDVCANVAYHVADFLIKRWRAWWCLTSQKGLQTADHSLTPYGDFPAVFVATEARFFFFFFFFTADHLKQFLWQQNQVFFGKPGDISSHLSGHKSGNR